MKRFLVILLFLLATGCAKTPELWHWESQDDGPSEQRRSEDIYECERYARQVDMDGPLDDYSRGRNYGGWGNFSFERCMESRGWRLVYGP